jgi:outer membrane protein assembly factor BamE (lipoprotein component of BamABCDE complex)
VVGGAEFAMLRFFLFVLMVHLSGCIIVPTSEKEPYQQDQIARVRPGETQREVILELFGEPKIRRENGGIWIYGEYHTQANWVSVYPPSEGRIKDYQFLVVEFETDTVTNIEVVEDKFGCSSRGICLRYGWREIGDVVASKRADDKHAKEFERIIGKCSLYVY